MSVDIKLNWTTSLPVSCLYAADCLLHNRPFADPAMSDALADPVARLQEALREERLPVEAIWSHVVPLAANFPGQLELATVALTKVIGRTEAQSRIGWLRGLLIDIRNAFTRAVPGSADDLAAGIEPLRQKWNLEGIGLLATMVNWTEPEIIVEEATVCLVHPVVGGGGAGHLPYNLAVIEAVPDDPLPELPEIVRLVWMLSTLNLDVPRYSESIENNRLGTVAALAMIPVALTAAAELRLTKQLPETLGLAVQSWMPAPEKATEWKTALEQWWETYSTMRPPWPTALKGLEVLLS